MINSVFFVFSKFSVPRNVYKFIDLCQGIKRKHCWDQRLKSKFNFGGDDLNSSHFRFAKSILKKIILAEE